MLLVALRKESVDRNFNIRGPATALPRSLSARRAWIEIRKGATLSALACVALRKESVDRNVSQTVNCSFRLSSLSARRAWIEISCRVGR